MSKIVVSVTVLLLLSCNFLGSKKEKPSMLEEKLKLMDADRAFAQLSADSGMRTAFMEYIDSNGVLLRPGRYPILGADAIDFLLQQDDKSFTMQWEPKGAGIANSGEMGYTYGLYKIKYNSPDTATYGTYVSVWKKQADGKWKFVLDSGNEGLGDPEE
jgi:ketosteroid isomerase-like protein